MAIQPIRLPGASRGGQALPLKPPRTPKVAVSPGGRVQPRHDTTGAVQHSTIPPPSAVDDAMAAYRQALAQLQTSAPPVDAAAIRQPYVQAQQAAGQLGVGYGQMVQSAGDAASQQFTTAQSEAQKAAAAFGVSAGAGANPTALQNNGAAPIALQTQANTTAAVSAAPQWQHLLENAAAGKIADATTARQGALDSAQMSLASSIPSLISDEKNRAFQAKTEGFNERLAETQLTSKQAADLRNYNLDVTKANNTSANQTANRNASNQRSANSINAANQRQDKSLAAADKRQAKSLKAAQSKATARGVQGISQLNAGLKATTTTALKPVIGHSVTYPSDPNGVNAGAPPFSDFVPAGQQPKPPPGYLPPTNQGKAVLGQAKKGASSLTLSRWNQLFAQLKAANRASGISDSELLPLMPARPKK